MDFDIHNGVFKVLCDEKLFGTKEIEISYLLYQQGTEDLSEYLKYVREHYADMYREILSNLLSAYKKYPKWDIRNEDTHTFSRIDLQGEEDVHGVIGVPFVQIVNRENQILFGFTFCENNKMSVEHGFCAVFDERGLILIADTDFENLLRFWDQHDKFNIL